MNKVEDINRSPASQRFPAGARPPVETLDVAKSLLSAHHAEHCARRSRHHLKSAQLQAQTRALLLAHVRPDDAAMQALAQAQRKRAEHRLAGNGHVRRERRVLDQHIATAIQPSLTLAIAPYDFQWVSIHGDGWARADHATGDYGLRVHSLGAGGASMAAGVGFWFHSGAGNPMQRFASLIDYWDDWWDSAHFYVAHNDGRTRLWVFGASERAWVAQSEQSPSWNDGVGWLEDHGNDPVGEDSTVLNTTYFNAAPDSWYQCWIWSVGDVYADSGEWGTSDAFINLDVSVQLGVLGSL